MKFNRTKQLFSRLFNSRSAILMILFIVGLSSKAQNLSIGEAMPDFHAKTVINYSNEQLKLSDFRGKAVILDFWSTWCGVCVEKMPKMADLQKRFSSDISILYVTTQKENEVQKFFEKRKDPKSLDLPMILGDTQLVKLFPHSTIPHLVWIGKDGQIKAITGYSSVTNENVLALINNENLRLPVKKEIINFDYEANIAVKEEIAGRLLFGSAITDRMEGVLAQAGIRESNEKIRIYATNHTPLALYIRSVESQLRLIPGEYKLRVILNVHDKTIIENNDAQYCYEAIVYKASPDVNEDKVCGLMREDLDKYFGIRSKIEKRKMSFYIIDFMEGKSQHAGVKEGNDAISLENYTIFRISRYLNNHYKFPLQILYSGTDGSEINIRLQKEYKNIRLLRKDLNAAGINLKKVRKKIEVLVLSDNINRP